MSSSASLLSFSVSSSSSTHASLLPSSTPLCFSQPRSISISATFKRHRFSFSSVKGRTKFPTLPSSSTKTLLVRAAEYKFPDPIPEFADAVSYLFHFWLPFSLFVTSFSNFFFYFCLCFSGDEKIQKPPSRKAYEEGYIWRIR